MKGTFFSADFIKDSSENLRLIELNTDTAVLGDQVSNLDCSGLTSVIDSNSITDLEIIYKPYIHKEIVDHISASVASGSTSISNINLHAEDFNTIYPTAVTDSATKFILRLAYDESAILDSTYAKNRLNVFELFTSASIEDYTTAYYYSSSDGVTDTLDYEFNAANLPDAVIKDTDESHNPIDFFKIGSEVDGESNQDKWTGFINDNKAEDKLIEQFHYHSSSLDGNKLTSYRQFSIVYGSDLDVINLLSYQITSIFDLPTSITYNTSSYTNKLPDHHYYEFTTNFVKDGSAGMLSTHKVEMADDTFSALSDINVGDTVKSYFISGSPQVEGDLDTINWQLTGSTFPSGSYITSSDVVYKDEKNLKYGAVIELKVDSDSVFVGVGKQFLIYDSGSDITSFKLSQLIEPDNHYFYDKDSNLIDIDEANLYVTSDTGLEFVELDVEDTDTYIISGSTSFNSIVSHNAPCFVAGTNITLEGGKLLPIEEVKVGDSVLTYNFNKHTVEAQKVEGTGVKKVKSTVTYSFEDGTTLQATLDHPLYCAKHGWVSKDPAYTSAAYNLTTTEAAVGCEILKQDESTVKLTGIEVHEEETVVYNLKTVAVNHNFFANEYLVHNRGGSCFVAGTEISIEGGDYKNIEDIVVGDKVVTHNEETGEAELKEVYEVLAPIHSDIVTYTLADGSSVTSTYDHPYYVEGLNLKSSNPVKTNELYDLPKEVTQIGLGDILIKEDGTKSAITGIVAQEFKETQTYLLRVNDNHNYFANNILVHNK